jgi:indole-3-glycerol phosphate synthase/phosphoribosylanthranilate isomerase
VLDAILDGKRREVDRARRERPLALLRQGLVRSDRDFEMALRATRTGFILEHKRRSPSGLATPTGSTPAAIARAYAPFADAISVLTEAPHFGGSLEDLRHVRRAVRLPVLQKDFLLDPYQVFEAREAGADAVLLILSLLDDAAWRACAGAARECGMGVLTEVHTGAELDRAIALGAGVIGINSRDLRTLEVDLGRIRELAPRVPPDRIVVAESGIGSRADVLALRDCADSLLVGSSLLRHADVAQAVRRLVFGEVKVCGLTRPEDSRAAWEAGASWGGLVFAAESPRRVSPERAACVRRGAPLRWAGVFVNEAPERVARIARDLRLDAVQLHGEEGPEIVAAVRARVPFGCEVWKAVRVLRGAPRLEATGADRMLLDGWDRAARGGTGSRFDWNLVAGHPDRTRIVLAGGLTPEVAARAGGLGFAALDVCSGVEEVPGIKSRTRLAGFFAALRGTGRRAG